MKIIFACFLIVLFAGNLFAQSKEQPQPGRYQVVAGKIAVMDSMVLVDTWTGKTWKIGVGGAWVPMTKLDTPEQVSEAAKNAEKVRKLP
jgi:hypothetical protein